MTVGKELPPSRVTVWLGSMEGVHGKKDTDSLVKPYTPNFPWLKKDVEPAPADGIPYEEPEGWGLS